MPERELIEIKTCLRGTNALEPPKPKDATLARLTVASGTCGHASAMVGMRRCFVKGATLGFKLSKCMLGGTTLFFRASATLSKPASPAAPSRWPIIVLILPTNNRSSTVKLVGDVSLLKNALLIASASTGSL